MGSTFNYRLYEISVNIYQYAERMVMYPNDQSQLDYCKKEASNALIQCRTDLINWSPVSSPCKGKKLSGRWSVVVQMNDDTNYGFSYYPDQAHKIYVILLEMWRRFYHQDSIETVLNAAYELMGFKI